MDDTTPVPRRFNPRSPLTGWHTADNHLENWRIGWTLASICSLAGVVGYLTWLYGQAGVRDVNFVGPAVAQLSVAASLLVAATLWRWGHPYRSVYTAIAIAAAIAAGTAILPHLLVGRGWVVTMFGTLFGLTFWAAATVLVFSFALYTQQWWWGWHDLEMGAILAEREGFEPPAVSPAPR